MRGVAGTGQYDVGPRLVPREAIGRLGYAARPRFMEQEPERVRRQGEPTRQLAPRRQLAQCRGEALGPREDVAHREHQQRADAVGEGPWKHCAAGVLVHHMERHHHRVPHLVLDRPLQHPVFGVLRSGLGDAEMAELSFGFLLQKRRRDHVARLLVSFGQDAVQLEDVDVVGAEPA